MTPRTKKTIIAVGVVVSLVLVCVLSVFGILAGAAITSYRAAMRAGNEAATLQNLKTIAAVEVRYFHTHQRTFGTLDELISESGLSSKFSGSPPVADGYGFTLLLAPKPDGSSWYKLTADPLDRNSGTNHFYLDPGYECVRANPDRQAGPSDPCN